jgi:hypothetical protein
MLEGSSAMKRKHCKEDSHLFRSESIEIARVKLCHEGIIDNETFTL